MIENQELPVTISTTMSPEIGDLAAALAIAQASGMTAKLDKKNPHLRNNYASLTSVLKAGKKAFDQGCCLVQLPSVVDGMVYLESILAHSSGQWMKSTLCAPIGGNKGVQPVQAMGSTVSYLRRYAASAMLGIATGDDDDGESERQQPSQPQPRRQEPQRQQQNRPVQSTPSTPTPENKTNPRGRFFALASEKKLNDIEQRHLLGVHSRSEATPERFAACAQGLSAWGEKELSAVLDVVMCTSLTMMRTKYGALPGVTQRLITPSCEYNKKFIEAANE